MTNEARELKPGDVVTRAQIREVFGGSTQGGICPSIEKRSVNLYSDPHVGERLGYYDGWLAEDDDLGSIFEYTGAGMSGNQTFESGNKAILGHAEQDRILRIFTQVGKIPGTGTKTHKYLGEFSLDQLQPYVWRQVHGADGRDRNVVVFRLRPDGKVAQRSERDVIPVSEETIAELVPFTVVTASMLQTAPATTGALSTPTRRNKKSAGGSKAANTVTSGTFVVPEAFNTRMSLRSATASLIAVRRKAELTQEYKTHLESRGHKVGAFQIKIRGLSSTLRTDLYDATAHILYEVKGASAREDVRMALGKLLDYSRYVSTEARPETPQQVILLPTAPDADLYDLCARYNVGIVHRSENGNFADFMPRLQTKTSLAP